MAHITFQLVQGLPLHSTRRQPLPYHEGVLQSGSGVSVVRVVARGKLDICTLGSLSRCAVDTRTVDGQKAHLRNAAPTDAGIVYFCAGIVFLGAVPLRQYSRGLSILPGDVRSLKREGQLNSAGGTNLHSGPFHYDGDMCLTGISATAGLRFSKNNLLAKSSHTNSSVLFIADDYVRTIV